MAKTNFLYNPLTREETAWGLIYLIFQTFFLPLLLQLALAAVWPEGGAVALNLIYYVLNFTAVVIIFRRFFCRSFRDLFGRVGQILWKSALALLAAKVVTTVMNDFIWFYLPKYYVYTETGPVLINPNDSLISSMVSQQFPLMAIATIVLVPIAEELLHRGVVFGSLYPISPILAAIVSTALFCAVHVMGYIGSVGSVYFVILFVQYIPSALVLCWLYTSTDSIFAPILMHMAFNAMGIASL